MSGTIYAQQKNLADFPIWKGTVPILDNLDIELTERCINACIHCYINQPLHDSEAEARELLDRRVDQYNEAWDDGTGGNQSILCINILAEMFTGGDHQRELVNFWAYIQTTNFVRSLMKTIVDL